MQQDTCSDPADAAKVRNVADHGQLDPLTSETGVYTLDLRSVPTSNSAPVGRRLARCLKELLRGYDFECVGVTGIPMARTDHYPATTCPGRWRRLSRRPAGKARRAVRQQEEQT